MKINFKFTDSVPNDELRAYAESKVASFEKLLSPQAAEAAICAIEFRRGKHQSGDVCTAEVNLEADGTLHRVTKDEPTFEKAIDKVKDDILRSLRIEKEKQITASRKGGEAMKKMLQEESIQ